MLIQRHSEQREKARTERVGDISSHCVISDEQMEKMLIRDLLFRRFCEFSLFDTKLYPSTISQKTYNEPMNIRRTRMLMKKSQSSLRTPMTPNP